ncbi:MAG: ABC transporter permease subunit [Planctomycetota bacterium]
MLQRFLAMARNTFVETIRQPIYGVILIAVALLMMLNVALTAFTLDDDNKLLLDVGLSTLLLGGLFLSAFSASAVLASEIENKTVLTIVSKPVSRTLFVLSKFVGLAAALSVAYYLTVLLFILTQRHGVLQRATDPWDAPVLVFGFGSIAVSCLASAFCNYFYGWNFPASVIAFVTPLLTISVLGVAKLSEKWEVIPFFSNFVGGQVIIAAYLVFLAVMVATAVALAASTRLGQLMTLLVCVCFLAIGVASDYAFGQHQLPSFENLITANAEIQSTLGAITYRLLPNLGPFWVIDGLTAGAEETTVPLIYVSYVTTYAFLIIVAILGIAVALFEKREVG